MKTSTKNTHGQQPTANSQLILTIDVECWAQSTLDPVLPIYPHAETNMHAMLDLLAGEKVKATCFVLGLFADKFPDCVKRIADDGHEVASHGYGHVDSARLTPQEFREDVRRSKTQLEALIGKPVVGYRAPCFSLITRSFCLLNVLGEEGFLYDSSINPSQIPNKREANCPTRPVRVELRNGQHLAELPAATYRLAGRDLPVAGGGYHRLLPWPLIRHAIDRTLSAGIPFVHYCHPYEIDPDEFARLPYKVHPKTRFHQGLGRRGLKTKFTRMIRQFPPALAMDVASRSDLPLFTLDCGLKSPAMRCGCLWRGLEGEKF